MNAIESRKTRYEESLEEVTLEALVATVSESVEPGEAAIIPHVVNRILRQAQATPAGR